MIIVDRLLAERQAAGQPIRVALVGAGFAGKGFALQLLTAAVGMRLVVVYNRTISEAVSAYRGGGIESPRTVKNTGELEDAIKAGEYAVTDNPSVVYETASVDVVVEATGEIEFASQIAMGAINNGKHIILLNAELDATLGPILKIKADKAGVVFSQADGDQPAVLMNLLRYVKSIGFKPVMAGNIKSLQDCRRTPTTQLDFATRVWQRPKFITSFADGTKISQEMATVSNATGFKILTRGMHGHRCSHVDEAYKLFPLDAMLNGGVTDYILGAQPSFGVFILGYGDQPTRAKYMKVYKMGDGPLYTFYVPTHLSPIEAPLTVARVALFRDAALAPIAGPVADVITIAKRPLKAGEVLDGIGGYLSYGTIDNSDTCRRQNLLPMGLSEGCVLKRDLPMDAAITFDDVQLPSGRLSDKLWAEQVAYFKQPAPEAIASR